jgi:carboxypeptidase family protein
VKALRLLLLLMCALLAADRAFAQAPAAATLHVTVVDQTGGVIPNATVSVSGVEESTKSVAAQPVTSGTNGIATIAGLRAGRYAIEATFPGFETRLLKDVRLRNGDNKQVAMLTIARLQTDVTVGQDRQQAAADPRGPSFGTTLTREQLEALSDDPDELRQQLQDMAGPGAVIRVDSFEGGALPAKAQIRSIRISRDQFAAENHSAGGVFIEIVTQPGLGPVRGGIMMRLRDGALSARNPFTPTKGPERMWNYGMFLSGTLLKEKSSFSFNTNGVSSFDTPSLNAALPGRIRSESLPIRAPRDNRFVAAFWDYALTRDQLLRVAYFQGNFHNDNLGVGAYDLAERAYSTTQLDRNVRIQEVGPIGRRFFTNTRVNVGWSTSTSHSLVEAPTYVVQDAFTTGGRQVAGGNRAKSLSVASDLDYVRGVHSLRTGLVLDGRWVRSDNTSNYLGTYIFESLEAYEAGRPRAYSRRIGDPAIRYSNLQAGAYIQDDIRIRRNVTLSPGLRYEAQTHVRDYDNVAPRFGVTWAPRTNGSTTLRASAGIFHDWLNAGTYEQTLRVDGFRQQEVSILDPSFPETGDDGLVPPIARYLLGDEVVAPRLTRVSAGVDQSLARNTRIALTYSHIRGTGVPRGLNLNAPVDGVRPAPLFANIVEVVSDAESRQHQIQVDATINPGALIPASNGPRIGWNRTTLFVNYTLGRLRDQSDGAFGLPATGVLAEEWGPAVNDVRHRINVTFNNQIIRNLGMGINVNANSGGAYTLRTGRDDNGDQVFNDRPSGVGRNTLRMPPQVTINTNLSYTFAFGRVARPAPPGIGVFGGGGAISVRSIEQDNARYRLQLMVNVQNLTNRPNFLGFSGVQTSPFFERATAVTGMRKVDVGLGLNF